MGEIINLFTDTNNIPHLGLTAADLETRSHAQELLALMDEFGIDANEAESLFEFEQSL